MINRPVTVTLIRPRQFCRATLLLLLTLIALSYGMTLHAADKIRVAILKFGTTNWEMDVIKRHALDRAEGLEIEIVKLAGKQATMVALQSGDADIAVTDWLWVSRQRKSGKPFTFIPYSTALGALVARPNSPVGSLADLPGKRLGIAGGPLDKSWLLLQALALQRHDIDLAKSVTPVFAAPPLLNRQLEQGKIDAVINFWPYVARLQSQGMRKLLGINEILSALGIDSDIPIIGYVFDEHWASANRHMIDGFVRAVTKAKEIMRNSDQEWRKIRPLMKAEDNATFKALRDGFRAGIPGRWNNRSEKDAEELYAILARYGGSRLTGGAERLSRGTFWAELIR